MDDFEEIEGAGDPTSPNNSTRQRNDTERNTNEVASMPTGTLCALALAVLDVSIATDTDKIIKAARDKLTALGAQHPLTFLPLVSSSYPLRAITNESTGLLVVTLPADEDFTRQILSEWQLCDTYVQESCYFAGAFLDPVLQDDGSYEVKSGPDSTGCIYLNIVS